MTSSTDIANRALQMIGDSAITSIDDNTPRARECKRAYDAVRRSELRAHKWNFARTRIVLAPDVDAPAFDFTYQYTWPGDCLRLLPSAEDGWTIEGRKILTDDGPTLNVRYIKDVTDENEFDAVFVEAFASRLAMEVCERLTGSASATQLREQFYDAAIKIARKTGAFEQMSEEPPTDDWVLARY